MRKKLFLAILLINCAVVAFSQAETQRRPILAILPFTGGAEGDGNFIAGLLSNQRELRNVFTVAPRTSALDAIFEEHYLQLSGLTDADTIAGIGQMLGADYVLSGSIRQLGNRNLLIAAIINVSTFEQVAGYWYTYRRIGEIRDFLPSMSKNLVNAITERSNIDLPSLAIAPFTRHARINIDDAESLAHIFAIEILNTGSFAVLPRLSSIQAAYAEQDFQLEGNVSDAGAVAIGRAINADFVLHGEILTGLGGMNVFMAQILHVRDGSLLEGDQVDYRSITDGIYLMKELALLLTDQENAVALIANLRRERSRTARFGDPTKFWSLGVSAGTSFADPWVTATIRGTLAPLRHSFIELGCDFGFITNVEGASYNSFYPFVNYALFFPFTNGGGWYMGAGGGFMMAQYRIDTFSDTSINPAANFKIGFNINNFFDISYTLRTDFKSASSKAAVGFTYRFRE
jgi:TolB-like protein